MTTFTVTNVEERPDGSAWAYGGVAVSLAGPQYDSTGHSLGGVSKRQTDGSGAVSIAGLEVGKVYTWTHPDGSQDTFSSAGAGTFALSTLVGPFVPVGVVAATQAYVQAQLGTIALADRAVSGDATAAVGDMLLVDDTTGNVAVTTPASPAVGDRFGVIKIASSAHAVTVSGSGATFNGDATTTVLSQWTGAIFRHTGSGAWVLESIINNSAGGAAALSDVSSVASGALSASQFTAADATTGNRAYTVPAPTSATVGQRLALKRVDASANAVTLSYPSSSGTTTLSLILRGESKILRQNTSSTYTVEAGDTPVSQLDVRYPQKPAVVRIGLRGPTWMCIGDSLTDFNGDQVDTSVFQPSWNYNPPSSRVPANEGSRTWALWAQWYSNSRVRHIGVAATAGMTSQQIHDTHLPTALAMKPTYCVVLSGQNDPLTGAWLTTGQTAYKDMVKQLLDAGITPILAKIPAANFGVAKNAFIVQLADDNGLPVVDFYGATVDPTTGLYLTGYAGADGIHPIEPGAHSMGRNLGAVLTALEPRPLGEMHLGVSDIYDQVGVGDTLLVSHPLLLTDTGGATPAATSWAPQASAATSTFSTDANCLGRRWDIVRDGIKDANYRSGDMPITAGDRLILAMRLGASVAGVGGSWQVTFEDPDSGAVLIDTGQLKTDLEFGKCWVVDYRVPATYSGTRIRAHLYARGAAGATISVAQPTFKNLTTLSSNAGKV